MVLKEGWLDISFVVLKNTLINYHSVLESVITLLYTPTSECFKLYKHNIKTPRTYVALAKNLKSLDYQILSLLLKNSKMSDRWIAKKLGVSQPTVTRRRTKLEKELIETYTLIPDFLKLGYQILAFTFVKLKSYPDVKHAEEIVQRGKDWADKHPNVIFAADGEGLGKDVVMMSLHKNYSLYTEFMRTYAFDWGEIISDLGSFLISLGSGFKMKPLNLKYIADDFSAS